MTPSKTKKAFPSSTSTTFPEHPITTTQWKTALQRVKLLYLQGRLKECSARCSLLLSEVDRSPHPLNASYLNFYLAVSTEGLSRQTHNFSATKIQLLRQAKACYQAAASSLPIIESVIESDEYSDPEQSVKGHALTSPSTLSMPSPTLPSSPASPISLSPLPNDDSDYDDYDVPKPSPLRIRKSSTHPHPLSPLKNMPVSHLLSPVKPILPSSPPPTPPPTFTSSGVVQTGAYHRFRAHLFAFTEMLATHASAVDGLIHVAEQAQKDRHVRRLPSHGASAFADDETLRAEDRNWRITRLRERGWRRKRFEPDRYVSLCERALAEL
ncbi:hypothetical protein MMC07_004519 [Pseudocyphellaria aurata]|nr:hypothetical protein [Pseudocyphellaria aurata]